MTTVTLSARKLGILLADWRTSGPAYTALADRIGLLIIDGRIAAHTRLPAERELAEALILSRTTVSSAYRELRERGYLRSVQGSGSVTQIPLRERASSPLAIPGSQRYDLTAACPAAWPGLRQLTERTLANTPEIFADRGYDVVGIPELRERIAARYTERGLPTTADQIMVTIGAQHAINLLSRFLLRRGDRALIESPSYPHAFDALNATGARLNTIPVRFEGWDADEIEALLKRVSPSAAYLIPDFHNPTGMSMPIETRRRVIRAAEREGTTLIIDETTAELPFDLARQSIPFAAAVPEGEADHVATIGSLSKTVWGGLRIGWVRSTPSTIRSLVASRPTHDLGTPTFDQHVALNAFDELNDIVQFRSQQINASFAALTTALERYIPEWTLFPAEGGVCTWANLGAPVSSALTLAAHANGVGLTAGPRFWTGR